MSPTATATKTFEATLAPLTAHKERRLQRTEATYRRALRDAFDTDCTTQTAINNVATDYDLSSCAKEHSNSTSHDFDAEELVEDYPVRFTNRGWHHDHSPDRAHEFCCGHVGHRDSDEFRCTNESC